MLQGTPLLLIDTRDRVYFQSSSRLQLIESAKRQMLDLDAQLLAANTDSYDTFDVILVPDHVIHFNGPQTESSCPQTRPHTPPTRLFAGCLINARQNHRWTLLRGFTTRSLVIASWRAWRAMLLTDRSVHSSTESVVSIEGRVFFRVYALLQPPARAGDFSFRRSY